MSFFTPGQPKHQRQAGSPVPCGASHMSRKQGDHDYNLRSMSKLMGERWRRGDDRGERSLIKAPSSASISSQGAPAPAPAGAAGAGAGAPAAPAVAAAAAASSSSSTGDLERAARKQFQRDVTPGFVYVLAAFSALGGFLFGYDTGVISGAMLLLKRELELSALWQELLISSTVAAAALSALLGGFLNGLFGRRLCILLASSFFAVGGVVLSSAPGKEVLLTGRLVVGVGLGIASMTVPVYIAEASPPHLRGQLVTVNTLFITGGQFTASLVDGAFSYLQRDGWRYMLGLSVLPAMLQFVGFLFLPESPRWLIQRGLTQKARRVLSQIRGNQNIDEEYDSIKNSIEEEEKDSGGDGPVIWRMLTYPPTRRALLVGCGLQMFQQLSGINTVMYYSATILQMSGVRDDRLAIWLAGLTTLTNFLFTLLGVWLVERVGRRKLILGSNAGTCLSLSLLATGFLISAQHSPPVSFHPLDPAMANSTCSKYQLCEPCMLDPGCGFCYRENGSALLASSCVTVDKASTERAAWGRCSNSSLMRDQTYWAYNYCPTSYSWLVLMGLVLYLAAFAPGMGPMPWTINSEIYPLWARSTGNACAAGVNWTFNILVSVTFLHLAHYLTYYGAFFLYSSMALLGFVFTYGCLPETKGRRLEEIEALFENQLCSCGASDSDEGRQVEYIRVKGSNYHLSDNDASDVD
ncbi:proton myo-inositol cotransporter isoform X1 [Scophthalmus maximus]|uniref:proton myo-inositol cotransporter isoform X1 n=2 Tax=Scophthalmus maximus TaxID=52904 RepID=UPI001FA90037|nr:proton myo-inositol cotransporter isoform X1 [Scophthalmus maximus]